MDEENHNWLMIFAFGIAGLSVLTLAYMLCTYNKRTINPLNIDDKLYDTLNSLNTQQCQLQRQNDMLNFQLQNLKQAEADKVKEEEPPQIIENLSPNIPMENISFESLVKTNGVRRRTFNMS